MTVPSALEFVPAGSHEHSRDPIFRFPTLLSSPRGLAPLAMLATTLMVSGFASKADAQDACCFEPAYRLQCETVVQKVPQQRFRLSYKTEMVEEESISYRPVLRMREEEREYTVPTPVTETKYIEETYSVLRPVMETKIREEKMTRTRYVEETAEREETVTQYRPVTETQYYQQQYAVQRPVTETQMREQQYYVQRPVTETLMQTQQYTSLRPVTSVQQQTVDAGGYVAQQVVTPGQLQYGVGWNRAAYAVPGPLGIFSLNRGAPALVPQYTPPRVQTQYSYRPNYITQQVARTSYVPEVQQVQTPVQVQRMQTELVRQQVPVQVQRMQTEMVTQNVPVQTTRMVPTVIKRKVPYTVQRPVTETLVRRVPHQEQRYVREERVRQVPVRTTRMTYVTKREKVSVPYYEQEEVRRKVLRPVTRTVVEPYTVYVDMPQQVMQRIPLNYSDPFSAGISQGYSTFGSILPGTIIESSSPSSSSPIRSNRPAIDGPEVSQPGSSDTILEAPQAGFDEGAQTPLENVRRKVVADDDGMGLNGADGAGADDDSANQEEELLDPPSASDLQETRLRRQPSVFPTSHRVRWTPVVSGREI